MNKEYEKAILAIPELFAQLQAAEPLKRKGTVDQKAKAGVYVLLENGIPVHVGRTRNLAGRLRGHISRSHYSASFAFKRARRALDVKASYRPENSRSALQADPVFSVEFFNQISLVKEMDVKFVEVTDPILQYLLELYAHMEYGLPLDEFDTH
jgi:hypothetical protein